MGKKKILGTCHLCGSFGELTFEHVPPRAAFNNRPVIHLTHDDAFKLRPEQVPKGPIQQRGMGSYSLCAPCNNKTGQWYGSSFVDWCYEGLNILQRTGGRPTLYHVSYSYPLRIIKQISAMFFTVCSPTFAQKTRSLFASCSIVRQLDYRQNIVSSPTTIWKEDFGSRDRLAYWTYTKARPHSLPRYLTLRSDT